MLSALATLALVSPVWSSSSDNLPMVDFERVDLNGRPLRLSGFRGQWVVVNFWATWCGPCIREMPVLRAFHDEREDATVIGVNFEEIDSELLLAFVAELEIDYPVVRAGNQPLLPFEPLKGLPTTFVVSPRGTLVAGKVGEIDRAWLDANVPVVVESVDSGVEKLQ